MMSTLICIPGTSTTPSPSGARRAKLRWGSGVLRSRSHHANARAARSGNAAGLERSRTGSPQAERQQLS
eukprot:tig00000806_g4360.t1